MSAIRWRSFGILLLTFACAGASAQDGDEKLSKRVEKIDEKFAKALAELATKYSEDGDVESAHFFAECYRGLGKKDEKIDAIWRDWEIKVYLGKDQGGKPLEKTAPIRQKVGGVDGEYKKVVDDILAVAKKEKKAPSEATAKILRVCMVKYEMARAPEDYIRTIKRINSMRRSMGLRAILWDFENSRKLVLASACWADVMDSLGEITEKNKQSPFFAGDEMKFAIENAVYGYADVGKWAEQIRAYAFGRSPLLNPNARRLWLGHWKRFDEFVAVSAYQIPQLTYREDIPTPSQHYEHETVVKDWVDTEETFEAKGKKLPLVRYPFAGETDVPWYFGEPGPKGTEAGWSEKEHEFTKLAGVPIMLRFYGKADLSDVEGRLMTKSGSEVAVRVYTNGDTRTPGIGDWPTILLIPEKELERGTAYNVSLKAKVNGTTFEKSWSFTTRK